MSHPISYKISYIILSVILVATFISTFFFTYVSSVEREIVQIQVKRIINEISDGVELYVPEVYIKDFKDKIDDYHIPDMKEEDEKVATSNKKLMIKTAIIFGCLVGAGILVILTLWYIYRFDIKYLIIYNLTMLLMVAGAYFLFTTYVIKKYYLVDDNFVKYVMFTNLKDYIEST